MRKPFYLRIIPYLLLIVTAVPFLGLGLWLGDHRDRQVTAYNAGIEYADHGQPDQAIGAFEAAAKIYLRADQTSWLEHFFLPRPDAELAALSFSHIGYLQVKALHNPGAGMTAYERSLLINSGVEWLPGASLVRNSGYEARFCTTMPDGPVKPSGEPLMEGPDDVCRLARLRAEALLVVSNYEQLKQQSPPGGHSEKGMSKKKKLPKDMKQKQVPALTPGGKGATKQQEDGY